MERHIKKRPVSLGVSSSETFLKGFCLNQNSEPPRHKAPPSASSIILLLPSPLRVNAVARGVIQTTTDAFRSRRPQPPPVAPADSPTPPSVGNRFSPSAVTLALFSIAPKAQRWHCAMSSPSYIQPKAVHASDHFKGNLQSLLHGGGKSPAPFIMPEFRPQSSSAQPAPYNAFQNMVSQSPMPRVSLRRQLS